MKDWDIVSYKLSNLTIDLVDKQGKERTINLKIDLETIKQKQKLVLLEMIKDNLNK